METLLGSRLRCRPHLTVKVISLTSTPHGPPTMPPTRSCSSVMEKASQGRCQHGGPTPPTVAVPHHNHAPRPGPSHASTASASHRRMSTMSRSTPFFPLMFYRVHTSFSIFFSLNNLFCRVHTSFLPYLSAEC
jgi:hypothetical protein